MPTQQIAYFVRQRVNGGCARRVRRTRYCLNRRLRRQSEVWHGMFCLGNALHFPLPVVLGTHSLGLGLGLAIFEKMHPPGNVLRPAEWKISLFWRVAISQESKKVDRCDGSASLLPCPPHGRSAQQKGIIHMSQKKVTHMDTKGREIFLQSRVWHAANFLKTKGGLPGFLFLPFTTVKPQLSLLPMFQEKRQVGHAAKAAWAWGKGAATYSRVAQPSCSAVPQTEKCTTPFFETNRGVYTFWYIISHIPASEYPPRPV